MGFVVVTFCLKCWFWKCRRRDRRPNTKTELWLLFHWILIEWPTKFSNRDQRKHLETLRNIEKHYILLLTIHKHGYLRSIPSYITINIREFIATYDLILEFHFNNIFPMLAENGMDIVYVCNLFKKCLQVTFCLCFKNLQWQSFLRLSGSCVPKVQKLCNLGAISLRNSQLLLHQCGRKARHTHGHHRSIIVAGLGEVHWVAVATIEEV